MNKTLKQQIRAEIKSNTYCYYKNTERCFSDYIYGDSYYVTLEDVVYRFLTIDESLVFDYKLGNIDFVQLVNDLYYHFIITDKKFNKNYAGGSERHRKNYIMKSMKNATEPLLIKQLKENEVITMELEELNQFKDLHYISIYSREGGLLEDLSYDFWQKEKSKKDEIEIQLVQLCKIVRFLNPLQRKVVYLVINNKNHSEIANILEIEHDKVRQILYFATEKLKAMTILKRLCA